jgi:hypothetical protein
MKMNICCTRNLGQLNKFNNLKRSILLGKLNKIIIKRERIKMLTGKLKLDKGTIGIALIGVLCFIFFINIVGFINDKYSNTSDEGYTLTNTTNVSQYQNDSQDMSSYLELSNVRPTHLNGLYNITGTITNTSSDRIDSIGDLMINDSNGNLIRIKALEVKLEPNQSMVFDEIVDTDQMGYSVELQNFENFAE